MTLTFATHAHSEVGLVRKNNQDSAFVAPNLVVVADGMGGAAAGDLASAIAVDEIATMDADLAVRLAGASDVRPETAPTNLPAGRPGDLLAVLADALVRTNVRLSEAVAVNPDAEGMGTTLCSIGLIDDAAVLVNIGDSRAYRLRDNVLTRLSRDHSWVQTLVDAGRITEEQALEHPHRSLIMRVLNGRPEHVPDLGIIDVRAGDRVLVCSDGLCGLVTDSQIAARVAASDREVAVASLVDLAHAAGGHDNITIIVADVVEGEPVGRTQVLGSARSGILAQTEATGRLPQIEVPNSTQDAESARYAPVAGGRRRITRLVVAVLLPVLLLAGAGFSWYSYSQTRYYLGPNDDTVAVFRGVPDLVLGQRLNSVVADEGVLLNDLPPFYRAKVQSIIQVDNEASGVARLADLKTIAAKCVAQRKARAEATTTPSPTPTPAPTTTPTPTTPATSATGTPSTPSAAPTPTATATPSPSAPPVPAAPEDC